MAEVELDDAQRGERREEEEEEAGRGGTSKPEGDGAVLLRPADSQRTPVAVFLGSFFATVATILGTGILALPVKLSRCGFAPFLLEFTLALLAQAAVIVLFVELLQHTVSTVRKHGAEIAEPLNAAEGGPGGDSAGDGPSEQDQEEQQQRQQAVPREGEHTDLHTMGHLFLKSRAARVAFNVAILFHFVTVLTSYGVAGPQAFGQLLGISPVALTAPYVCGLTALVVFGQRVLNSAVSVMTFAKGVLLCLVVAITGAVASRANQTYNDDWKYVADPFLVTTVALGGAINVLPVYFQRVSFNRSDVRKFRLAALAGLAAVWVLNLLWALFLLQVVPQEGDPSLTAASRRGEIASVPLSDVIHADYPKYAWVLWITRVFVAISVSVSFLALGSGLKHLLDGLAFHLRDLPRVRARIRSEAHLRRARLALYAACFGAVLLVALTASGAFFEILGTWTSLALNLESGIFVVLMVHAARAAGLPTPDGKPPLGTILKWFVFAYFGFAVVYDMVRFMAGKKE